MSKHNFRRAGAIGCVLLSAGCNSARTVVPEPNAISLQSALVGTVQALNAAFAEARRPGNVVLGYYPCTVTATFNISATGNTADKAGLAITGTPGTGIAIGANAARDDTLSGTRGNTVEVVLASSMCLPGPVPPAKAAPPAHGKPPSGKPAATVDGPAPPPMPSPVFLVPPRPRTPDIQGN